MQLPRIYEKIFDGHDPEQEIRELENHDRSGAGQLTESPGIFITPIKFTLTLHKSLVQKRYARPISGHQETLIHFQDFTVC